MTFINRTKIRSMAEAGDQFFSGAAWVLDQLDAEAAGVTDSRSAYLGDHLTMDQARAMIQARHNATGLDYESQRQH